MSNTNIEELQSTHKINNEPAASSIFTEPNNHNHAQNNNYGDNKRKNITLIEEDLGNLEPNVKKRVVDSDQAQPSQEDSTQSTENTDNKSNTEVKVVSKDNINALSEVKTPTNNETKPSNTNKSPLPSPNKPLLFNLHNQEAIFKRVNQQAAALFNPNFSNTPHGDKKHPTISIPNQTPPIKSKLFLSPQSGTIFSKLNSHRIVINTNDQGISPKSLSTTPTTTGNFFPHMNRNTSMPSSQPNSNSNSQMIPESPKSQEEKSPNLPIGKSSSDPLKASEIQFKERKQGNSEKMQKNNQDNGVNENMSDQDDENNELDSFLPIPENYQPLPDLKFDINLYQIFKAIHPELGISQDSVMVINYILEKIALTLINDAQNQVEEPEGLLRPIEFENAVKRLFPEGLAQRAIEEGVRAVEEYDKLKPDDKGQPEQY